MDDTTRDEQAGDVDGQLTLPTIAPTTVTIDPPKSRKKAMGYEYSDSPVEPTGRQNIYVLWLLRKHPNGLTTIQLVEMGIADPRPRVRDLRELGHRIETIQPSPHDVGRYVLMSGKAVPA